jgi:hypothetical protein
MFYRFKKYLSSARCSLLPKLTQNTTYDKIYPMLLRMCMVVKKWSSSTALELVDAIRILFASPIFSYLNKLWYLKLSAVHY